MGRPDWSDDPRFSDRAVRDRNWAELYPLLAEWSQERTRSALAEAAQAQRVACLPLGTAADLLLSSQLAAPEFFVEVHDPNLADVKMRMPGRPYHLTARAAEGDNLNKGSEVRRVRAPRVGEHTAEVLDALAGSKRPQAERVTGSREGFNGLFGNSFQPFVRLPEQGREFAAGMELEAFLGVLSDLRIT